MCFCKWTYCKFAHFYSFCKCYRVPDTESAPIRLLDSNNLRTAHASILSLWTLEPISAYFHQNEWFLKALHKCALTNLVFSSSDL